MKTRVLYIDMAKGFAMITIVMLHLSLFNLCGDAALKINFFNHCFNVKLFFFLSGMVAALSHADFSRWKDIKLFFQNKTLRLLLPFVVWSVIILPFVYNRSDINQFGHFLIAPFLPPYQDYWFILYLYVILLLFLVTIGLLCFNFDDIVISIISSVEDFPLTADDLYSYLPSVTFVLVAFASLMTFITATMISLEGKAFDSLKSMPISGRRVIISKVLAAMLLITPVTALGSFIMIIRFGFDIVDSILVLFGVVVIPLVTELIGIMINLKYARFDADNDAVIVRQSASVLIATFLGLALVFVTIPLTFVAVIFAGQMEGLLMMDAFFMIVSSYLYFAIAMRGEENYMKLSV